MSYGNGDALVRLRIFSLSFWLLNLYFIELYRIILYTIIIHDVMLYCNFSLSRAPDPRKRFLFAAQYPSHSVKPDSSKRVSETLNPLFLKMTRLAPKAPKL